MSPVPGAHALDNLNFLFFVNDLDGGLRTDVGVTNTFQRLGGFAYVASTNDEGPLCLLT